MSELRAAFEARVASGMRPVAALAKALGCDYVASDSAWALEAEYSELRLYATAYVNNLLLWDLVLCGARWSRSRHADELSACRKIIQVIDGR